MIYLQRQKGGKKNVEKRETEIPHHYCWQITQTKIMHTLHLHIYALEHWHGFPKQQVGLFENTMKFK